MYHKFRVGVRYLFALVLLSRSLSLPHIGYKLFEVPIENHGFNFLLQFKALDDFTTVILVKFIIFYTTPHVGIFSYRFRWAE